VPDGYQTLSQDYAFLRPDGRLALYSKARIRNDEIEIGRLLNSAPSVHYRVAHHFGNLDTLADLASSVLCELLDLALHFYQCLGRVEAKSPEEKEQVERAYQTAQVFAYLFLTKLEGWRLFLDRKHIDRDYPWLGLPCCDSILDAEQLMTGLEVPKEQAEVILLEKGKETSLFTPEDFAQWIGEQYDQILSEWG
jgi:hypothetical protein